MINLSFTGLQFSTPAGKAISSGSFPELVRVESWVFTEDGLQFYSSVTSWNTDTPVSVWSDWISEDYLEIIQ